MPAPLDTDPKLARYAHPERLVTTQWLADHAGDPGLVIAESDEDVLLYETGHIPGAVKIDWHADLNDQLTRDYVDAEGFARLMSSKGITRDTTIVFYGDNFNWWAAYALWVCSLFGHPDVRLLDGGRQRWIAEGRPHDDRRPDARRRPSIRSSRATTRRSARSRTTCSPTSATGRWSTCDHRASTAASSPTWSTIRRRARCAPGTSRPRKTCPGAAPPTRTGRSAGRGACRRSTSRSSGSRPSDDVVAYCRIGERSSHTWFVLTHLLGLPNVRNYDGSWVEWGNAVRVPIERPAGSAA